MKSHKLPPINEDIVDKKYSPTIKMASHSHYNIALVPNLQEIKDYIFLTEELWGLFVDYGYPAL